MDVLKDKVQCLNCRLLERISRDVISDMFEDVSEDKTLFTLLSCPLKSNSWRHDLGHVFGHIDQASSGNSGLYYGVPGKSEKLLFV